MIDAPFALAFTAGLVATVNPCGFAMLPAYLGYFMGLADDVEGPVDRAHAIRRGLVIGAVVSGGFLLVFGVVGVLVTLGLRSIIDLIPWAAIVIGGGVGLLGIAMLAGYEPVVSLPKLRRTGSGRDQSAVFLFGISYAVASLSCTLPIFLTVVAGAIRRVQARRGDLGRMRGLTAHRKRPHWATPTAVSVHPPRSRVIARATTPGRAGS